MDDQHPGPVFLILRTAPLGLSATGPFDPIATHLPERHEFPTVEDAIEEYKVMPPGQQLCAERIIDRAGNTSLDRRELEERAGDRPRCA